MNVGARGSRRSISHTIRVAFSVAAGLALAASALSISTVAASTNSKSCSSANGIKVTNTTVCSGLAFYTGKTLVFVAPTSAGSAYDVESRAMAKEIGTYLGATINVEDISNVIAGQDNLAAASPDGLTIGYYSMASNFYDKITNSPNVNFNFKNVTLLGGLPNNTDILVTQSSSPYTSFAVLKKLDSPTNPVKILVTPGAAAAENILFMREFGLPVTYVTGYPNSAALATGFIRGDGQLDGSGIAAMQAYVEAGSVRVLAVETQSLQPAQTIPLYSTLQNFPTAGALLKKYPPKTNGEKAAIKYVSLVETIPNYVLGTPAGIASEYSKTLIAAVEYAAKSNYVKTQVLAVGNPDGYTNPVKDKVNLVRDLASAPKLESFLGY